MRSSLAVLTIGMTAFAVVLASCSGSARYKKTVAVPASTEGVAVKKGPPPHAPAHGYRHKHGNVVLVYESSLELYRVDGHDGYYFHEGSYYRVHKGGWQVGAGFEGPWKACSASKLPKGLHNTSHARAKSKAKK